MRKMAEELSVSKHTIRIVFKYDLKASLELRPKDTSLRNTSRPNKRSKKLLSIFKKDQPIILFSGEKLFTEDSESNCRIDCYISTSKPEDVLDSIRFKYRSKPPVSVMMFVASNGLKIPPVFY